MYEGWSTSSFSRIVPTVAGFFSTHITWSYNSQIFRAEKAYLKIKTMIKCSIDPSNWVPCSVWDIMKDYVVNCLIIQDHHVTTVFRRIENWSFKLNSLYFKEFYAIRGLATVKPLVLLVILRVLVFELDVYFFFSDIFDKQWPKILSLIPPWHRAFGWSNRTHIDLFKGPS